MANFSVIVAAAGKSARFQDKHYKKPFVPLANKPVWLYSVERFVNRDDVKQVIVVISKEDRDMFRTKFGANLAFLNLDLVEGGEERSDSIQKGLEAVKPDIDYVAIHDAARPCFVDRWVDTVFSAAQKTGAAILATPVTGTLKRSQDGSAIDETVDRSNLWQAQTPQVFRRDLIVESYAKLGNAKPTDDAQVVELAGHKVSIVEGSPMNLKITTRDDLKMAEKVLQALPKPKLTGPGNPFANDDMWR